MQTLTGDIKSQGIYTGKKKEKSLSEIFKYPNKWEHPIFMGQKS